MAAKDHTFGKKNSPATWRKNTRFQIFLKVGILRANQVDSHNPGSNFFCCEQNLALVTNCQDYGCNQAANSDLDKGSWQVKDELEKHVLQNW
jgi:hypothetical protein